MNDRPWDDPSKTGYGRRVPDEEHTAFVERAIESARRSKRSVLGNESGIFKTLIEFASKHGVFPVRDDWHGGEIWSFHLDYERLDRAVVVRVKRADWFEGWQFDIRSWAGWTAPPPQGYVVDKEYRWFGASSLCPPSMFLELLEVALEDAKRYTTEDLHPAPWPANAAFQRHW